MPAALKYLFILTICAFAAVGCKSNADDIAAFEKAQQTTPAEREAAANAEAQADEKADEKAEKAEKTDDLGDKPAEGVKEGEQAADLAPGEQRHFGAPFALETEPMTLAAALEASKNSEGPYKVEATVEKVCQVKGCWFTLSADDVEIPIRVRMKDYAFFVSKNADGAKAVLEGTLTRKVIEQKLAQHFAEDEAKASGEAVREVSGDEETFEFMASGLELTKLPS